VLEIFKRKEFVVTVDATRPALDIQAEIRERLKLPPLSGSVRAPASG
jgi:hypothetical protein